VALGHNPKANFPVPPEAWVSMRRMATRLREPVENFMAHQTAGGIVLLFAAAVALLWANLSAETYHHFWHTPITIGIGDFTFGPTEDHPTRGTLHFWINDGLMTVFFMLAGFEIKRELHHGELSDVKRASLPVATAIGGMVVPAVIFYSFNPSGPASAGWGVPMATDIAFALGILSLLGSRVPAALRILLLALAIIDDLGAILVIALFYSDQVDPLGIGIAGLGILILVVLRRGGARPGLIDAFALAPLWVGLLIAGVHPTLAGVIVGLSTPARPWLSQEVFGRIAEEALEEYDRKTEEGADEHSLLLPLQRLSVAGREAIASVVRGEAQFAPWVAYLIMPLFALANAGVTLGDVSLTDHAAVTVMLGVTLGLAIGKPIGVMGAGWVAVKLGLCELPRGVTWSGMFVVGLVAGIGFTMAIFIAELAFAGEPILLGLSKLSILIATAAAGVIAMVVGRLLLPKDLDPTVSRMTPAQAERSTEY